MPLLIILKNFVFTIDFILSLTEEDINKITQYKENKIRHEISKSYDNIESLYESLSIKINIKESDLFSIPRISTSKTNQFNLPENHQKDIERLHKDSN